VLDLIFQSQDFAVLKWWLDWYVDYDYCHTDNWGSYEFWGNQSECGVGWRGESLNYSLLIIRLNKEDYKNRTYNMEVKKQSKFHRQCNNSKCSFVCRLLMENQHLNLDANLCLFYFIYLFFLLSSFKPSRYLFL